MKDFLIKGFMKVNTFLIRMSGGRIGTRLGSQSILLLHHIGRKSGKAYVTPIAYFHRERKYLIVASNWGKDKQADWYKNLKKEPHTIIEVKGRAIPARAYEAEGEEYARLWKFATERHPPYLRYQEMTSRRIPIVVFEPTDS